MALSERRYRELGLALTGALTMSALVVSGHWGWLLAKLVLGAALAAYLALGFRRDHLNQEVVIELSGLEPEEAEGHLQTIREAVGPFSITRSERPQDGAPARLSFRQSDSVARVVRALRRGGPNADLVGVRSVLSYTALNAHGQAEVEVSGVAPANATVTLPGLEKPTLADDSGSFTVRLPFEVVRTHARRGILRGEWTKGDARDVLEVRVGQPG